MTPMLRPRFVLLAAAIAVTAHDATYVIGHGVGGYPAALSATGHDRHWLPVAIGVATLLLGAATVVTVRWWRLRRQVAELASGAAQHRIDRLAPRTVRLAARLFVAALAIFVIQENLEAVANGAAAPGPGIIIAPAYQAAAPVLVAVALLFAAMSELIDARILHLERVLAAVRGRLPRPSARRVRRSSRADVVPGRSRSAQPDLGRAPPASAHA